MRRFGQVLASEWASGRLADGAARAALIALPAAAALFLPSRSLSEAFESAGVGRGELFIESKRLVLRWGGAVALAVAAFFALGKTPRARLAGGDPVRRLGVAGLAALLGATLTASALSIAPAYSLWQSQTLALPAGLALLIAGARLRLRADLFLGAMFLAGGLIALATVAQRLGWNPLWAFYDLDMRHPDDRAGVIATIGNPEYLGGYLAALGAAAFALTLFSAPGRWRWASRAGVFGLFAMAALMTGTRSSLVALALGGLYGGLVAGRGLANRRRLLGALALFAALAMAGVAIFSTPNPLNRRGANVAGRFAKLLDWRSPSFTERLMLNVAGARLVLEKPLLGHGAGMFDARFYDALAALSREDETRTVAAAIERFQEKGAGAAHNDYLQIWVESGAVGLGGFLLLAICLLWPLPARSFEGANSPPRNRRCLAACQAALATLLILSLASFPLRTPERALLFWALAAHVMAGRD